MDPDSTTEGRLYATMRAMSTGDHDPEPTVEKMLASYADRDEEELLAEIGAAEHGESLGLRPAEFGRYLRAGRQWFDRNQQRFRDALCDHPAVKDIRAKVHSEVTTDAAVIADILLGSFGQVPATAAAVIIARRGLDALCP